MIDEKEIIAYDFDAVNEDGSDNLTQTLLELLNSYPGMEDEIVPGRIKFQKLETTSGIAIFAMPSVAILRERQDVTGHVEQRCAYSFTLVFRTRISGKEKVKEWLDNLGRWIEKVEYPALADGQEFEKISRTSQSHLYGTTEDKAEDWAISIQAIYTNEFDRPMR